MSGKSAKKKRLGSRRVAPNQNVSSHETHVTDDSSVAQHHALEKSSESLNVSSHPDDSKPETQQTPSPDATMSRRKLGSSRRNKGRQFAKASETEPYLEHREEVEEKTRGNKTVETTQTSLAAQLDRQEESRQGSVQDISATPRSSLSSANTPDYYYSEVTSPSASNSPEDVTENTTPKPGNLQADQARDNETKQENNDKSDTPQSAEMEKNVGIPEIPHLSSLPSLSAEQQLINTQLSDSKEMTEEELSHVYSVPQMGSNKNDDADLFRQDESLQGNTLESDSQVGSVALESDTDKSSHGENTAIKDNIEQTIFLLPKEELPPSEKLEELFNLSELRDDQRFEDTVTKVHEQDLQATQMQKVDQDDYSPESRILDATEKVDISAANLKDQAENTDVNQVELSGKVTDDFAPKQEVSNPDDKQDEHPIKADSLKADFKVVFDKSVGATLEGVDKSDTGTGGSEDDVQNVQEEEGQKTKMQKMQQIDNLSASATDDATDLLRLDENLPEDPLMSKTQVSPFKMEISIEEVSPGEHTELEVGAEKATDFTEVNVKKTQDEGGKTTEMLQIDNISASATDDATDNSKIIATLPSEVMVKSIEDSATKQEVSNPDDKNDIQPTKDKLNVLDQISEDNHRDTENKERDECTNLLRLDENLAEDPLVSKTQVSPFIMEISIEEVSPGEHTELEFGAEKATDFTEVNVKKMQEEEGKTAEMLQIDNISASATDDATDNSKIVEVMTTLPSEVMVPEDPLVSKTQVSPFIMEISIEEVSPGEHTELEFGAEKATDFTEVNVKKMQEEEGKTAEMLQIDNISASATDDATDNSKIVEVMTTLPSEVMVPEDPLVSKTQVSPFIMDISIEEVSPGEHTELEFGAEKATDFTEVNVKKMQEEEGKTAEMLQIDNISASATDDAIDNSKIVEVMTTLPSEVMVPEDPLVSKTQVSPFIMDISIEEVSPGEHTELEFGAEKATDFTEVNDKKMQEEEGKTAEMLQIDNISASATDDATDNSKIVEVMTTLPSEVMVPEDPLVSKTQVSPFIMEISIEEVSPGEHTELKFGNEKATDSSQKDNLSTKEEQLSNVSGTPHSEDAVKKVDDEQDIQPTQIQDDQQNDYPPESLILLDATEKVDTSFGNLKDQTDMRDTNQSELSVKITDDSAPQEEVPNPDDKQDERPTQERRLEVSDQRNEDSDVHDSKQPLINNTEREDTAVGQVNEGEGQVDNVVKHKDEQAVQQDNEGVISDVEKSTLSPQTLLSEIDAPFDSNRQDTSASVDEQTNTGLDLGGNRRKLGSSRRKKERKQGKESKEKVLENTTSDEARKVRATTEEDFKEMPDKSVGATVEEIDTSDTVAHQSEVNVKKMQEEEGKTAEMLQIDNISASATDDATDNSKIVEVITTLPSEVMVPEDPLVSKTQVSPFIMEISIEEVSPGEHTELEFGAEKATDFTEVNVKKMQEEEGKTAEMLQIDNISASATDDATDNSKIVEVMTTLPSEVMVPEDPLVSKTQVSPFIMDISIEEVSPGEHTELEFGAEKATDFTEVNVKKMQEEEGKTAEMLQIDNISASATDDATDNSKIVEVMTTLPSEVMVPEDPLVSKTQVSPFIMEISIEEVSPGEHTELEFGAEKATDFTEVNVKKMQEVEGKTAEMLQIDNISASATDDATDNSKIVEVMTTLPSEVMVPEDPLVSKTQVSPFIMEISIEEVSPGEHTELEFGAEKATDFTEVNVKKMQEEEGKTAEMLQIDNISASATDDATDNSKIVEVMTTLPSEVMVPEDPLVSKTQVSPFIMEISIEEVSPGEHTELKFGNEKATDSSQKDNLSTKEEQLSNVSGAPHSEDAIKKVDDEQDIQPTQIQDDQQNDYSPESLILLDATEKVDTSFGNLKDQTDMRDTNQSELSVKITDDSAPQEEVPNPDDKQDERPTQERRLEVSDQRNEDSDVHDSKQPLINNTEREDTAVGQVNEGEGQVDNVVKHKDEQAVQQDNEGVISDVEKSTLSPQTLLSEIDTPFNSNRQDTSASVDEQTNTGLDLGGNRRKLGSSRRKKERKQGKESKEEVLENATSDEAPKVIATSEEDFKEMPDKSVGATLKEIDTSDTVAHQSEVHVKKMQEEEGKTAEMLRIDNISASATDDATDNSKIVEVMTTLPSEVMVPEDPLVSKTQVSPFIMEISIEEVSPGEHTELEFGAEKATDFTEVNVKKMQEEEGKTAEMLQIDNISASATDDATDNSKIVEVMTTLPSEVMVPEDPLVSKTQVSPFIMDISIEEVSPGEHTELEFGAEKATDFTEVNVKKMQEEEGKTAEMLQIDNISASATDDAIDNSKIIEVMTTLPSEVMVPEDPLVSKTQVSPFIMDISIEEVSPGEHTELEFGAEKATDFTEVNVKKMQEEEGKTAEMLQIDNISASATDDATDNSKIVEVMTTLPSEVMVPEDPLVSKTQVSPFIMEISIEEVSPGEHTELKFGNEKATDSSQKDNLSTKEEQLSNVSGTPHSEDAVKKVDDEQDIQPTQIQDDQQNDYPPESLILLDATEKVDTSFGNLKDQTDMRDTNQSELSVKITDDSAPQEEVPNPDDKQDERPTQERRLEVSDQRNEDSDVHDSKQPLINNTEREDTAVGQVNEGEGQVDNVVKHKDEQAVQQDNEGVISDVEKSTLSPQTLLSEIDAPFDSNRQDTSASVDEQTNTGLDLGGNRRKLGSSRRKKERKQGKESKEKVLENTTSDEARKVRATTEEDFKEMPDKSVGATVEEIDTSDTVAHQSEVNVKKMQEEEGKTAEMLQIDNISASATDDATDNSKIVEVITTLPSEVMVPEDPLVSKTQVSPFIMEISIEEVSPGEHTELEFGAEKATDFTEVNVKKMQEEEGKTAEMLQIDNISASATDDATDNSKIVEVMTTLPSEVMVPEDPLVSKTQVSPFIMDISIEEVSPGEHTELEFGAEKATDFTEVNVKKMQEEEGKTAEMLQIDNISASATDDATDNSKIVEVMTTLPSEVMVPEDPLVSKTQVSPFIMEISIEEVSPGEHTELEFGAEKATDFTEVNVKKMQEVEGKTAEMLQIDNISASATDDATDNSKIVEVMTTLPSEVMVPEDPLVSKTQVSPFIMEISIEEVSPGEHTELEFGAEKATDFTEVNVKKMQEEEGKTAEMLQIDNISASATDDATDNSKIVEVMTTLPSEVMVPEDPLVSKTQVSPFIMEISIEEVSPGEHTELEFGAEKATDFTEVNVKKMQEEEGKTAEMLQIDNISASATDDATDNSKIVKVIPTLPSEVMVPEDPLVSKTQVSPFIMEISIEEVSPGEHTELKFGNEKATDSSQKDNLSTKEEQLSNVSGAPHSEDAIKKVDDEQDIQPTQIQDDQQNDYSPESLILLDATEKVDTSFGNLKDQTDMRDTNQSELSVKITDDSAPQEEVPNPDDKQDERPTQERRLEVSDQRNEDSDVHDSKQPLINNTEREDTAVGQVNEGEGQVDNVVKHKDEQAVQQDNEGVISDVEKSTLSPQTLLSEIDTPFNSNRQDTSASVDEQTNTGLDLGGNRRKLGSSRRKKERKQGKESKEEVLENATSDEAPKVIATSEEDFKEMPDKSVGATLKEIDTSDTVAHQSEVHVKKMQEEEGKTAEMLRIDNISASATDDATDNSKIVEVITTLPSEVMVPEDPLVSKTQVSPFIMEISIEEVSPGEHTELEFGAEKATDSSQKDRLSTKEEQLSSGSGTQHSEDAVKKVDDEQDIQPTQIQDDQQNDYSPETMILLDTTEKVDTSFGNLKDQTDMRDTNQSELSVKITDDSAPQEEVPNPDDNQDERPTQERRLEVSDQRNEDSDVHDSKQPLINNTEREDTAVEHVNEGEGQVDDVVKHKDEQAVQQDNEGVISDVEKSTLSPQTLLSEIDAPCDSNRQDTSASVDEQTNTVFDLGGNRRKLGSSRRKKERKQGKESKEEVLENATSDEAPKVIATSEEDFKEMPDKSVGATLEEIDTSDTVAHQSEDNVKKTQEEEGKTAEMLQIDNISANATDDATDNSKIIEIIATLPLEVMVESIDDSATKEEISNPDDRKDAQPTKEDNLDVLDQISEDNPDDTKTPQTSDIERVDTPLVQVSESEGTVEDDVKLNPEQTFHQEAANLLPELEDIKSPLQSSESETNVASDPQPHDSSAGIDEETITDNTQITEMKNTSPNLTQTNRRRKMGSTRRNLGSRNKGEDFDNEATETRLPEDFSQEAKHDVVPSVLHDSSMILVSTPGYSEVQKPAVTDHPEADLGSFIPKNENLHEDQEDRPTDFKEMSDKSVGATLESSPLQSSESETNVASDPKLHDSSAGIDEETNTGFQQRDVRRKLGSSRRNKGKRQFKEADENKIDHEHSETTETPSTTDEAQHLEDAVKKVHDQEIKPIQMQEMPQTDNTSVSVIDDATNITETFIDLTDIRDVYLSKLAVKSTDYDKKEIDFESSDQGKEADHVSDTKKSQLSDTERTDTALGDYVSESQVKDDIKSSAGKTGRQEAGLISEMGDSDSSLQSLQHELHSALDSKPQQNNTSFDSGGNTRKLGSSQEKSMETMLEGKDKSDSAQIKDTVHVKQNEYFGPLDGISEFSSSAAVDRQQVASNSSEMPDEELPITSDVTENKEKDENTELLRQDGRSLGSDMFSESHVESESKESPTTMEITTEKSSSREHAKVESSVEQSSESAPKKELALSEEQNECFNPFEVTGPEQSEDVINKVHEELINPIQGQELLQIDTGPKICLQALPSEINTPLDSQQDEPKSIKDESPTGPNPAKSRRKLGSSRRNKGKQHAKEDAPENTRDDEASTTPNISLATETARKEELTDIKSPEEIRKISSNVNEDENTEKLPDKDSTFSTDSSTVVTADNDFLKSNKDVDDKDKKPVKEDENISHLIGYDKDKIEACVQPPQASVWKDDSHMQNISHHGDNVDIVAQEEASQSQNTEDLLRQDIDVQQTNDVTETVGHVMMESSVDKQGEIGQNFEDSTNKTDADQEINTSNILISTAQERVEDVESGISTAMDASNSQEENPSDYKKTLQVKPNQKRRKLGSTRRNQLNRKPEGETDDKDETTESQVNTEADVRNLGEMQDVKELVLSAEVSQNENATTLLGAVYKEQQEGNEISSAHDEGHQPQSSTSNLQSSESNVTPGRDDLMALLPEPSASHTEEAVDPDRKDGGRNVVVGVEPLQPEEFTSSKTQITPVIAERNRRSLDQLLPLNTDTTTNTGITGGSPVLSETTQNDDERAESATEIQDKVSTQQKPNIVIEEAQVKIPEMKSASPNLTPTNRRRNMGSTRRNLGTRNKGEDLDNEARETEIIAGDVKTESVPGIKEKELQLHTEHNEGDPEQERLLDTVEKSQAGEYQSTPPTQQTDEKNPVSQGELLDTEQQTSDYLPSTSTKNDTMSMSASGGKRRKMGSHRKSRGHQGYGEQTEEQEGILAEQSETNVGSIPEEGVIKPYEKHKEEPLGLQNVSEGDDRDKKPSSSIIISKPGEHSRSVSEKTPFQPSHAENRPGQEQFSLGDPRGLRSDSYHVVMIGDSSVGKTSFMKRAQTGKFSLNIPSSIGLDSCMWTVVVDGKPVVLELWDTAGQERFRSITRHIFHRAQAFLLMYDVTCTESFSAVSYWANCIQESAVDDVIVLLLGNKSDCAKRQVKSEQGEILAKEYNFEFMECSAATGENVVQCLETVARMLNQKFGTIEEAAVVQHTEAGQQKRSTCC